MRIMYVEDNQANLFLVQRVARMGGHQVIFYMDGENALKNFATDKPDLVLMDVQLQGELNGLEVVRRLRAAGHTTPIVAVTAYAMVGDREKCFEAGCDGYLSKPLPVTELVELITRYEVRNALQTPAAPRQTGTLTPPAAAPSPAGSVPPAAPTPTTTPPSAAPEQVASTPPAAPTPTTTPPSAVSTPAQPALNGSPADQHKQ
jgi:CheY-like chemotaxis protein